MGVTLSINPPEEIVGRLRLRAERHHRSLEGELMTILAAAVEEDGPAFSAIAYVADLRARGHCSPDEATAMIREDRDHADGRH